jgi:hypothetical protein
MRKKQGAYITKNINMCNLRKILTLQLFCCLLNSCVVYDTEHISGKYESKWYGDDIHLQLILYNDNKFVYYRRVGLATPDTTFGKWVLNKREVFFEPDYLSPYYTVTYCDTCKLHNLILFNAETKEKESYVRIWAFYKSELKIHDETDSNGLIIFPDNIDSIVIKDDFFIENVNLNLNCCSNISNIELFIRTRRQLSPMSKVWYLKSRKKIQEEDGSILLNCGCDNVYPSMERFRHLTCRKICRRR